MYTVYLLWITTCDKYICLSWTTTWLIWSDYIFTKYNQVWGFGKPIVHPFSALCCKYEDILKMLYSIYWLNHPSDTDWSSRSHHQVEGICFTEAYASNGTQYDTFSVVVECWVCFWSNFQSGSRVLKRCYRPILMYSYGIQCVSMHRNH